MIILKRVYEEGPSLKADLVVLVDRLWPRGIKKEALKYDIWCKELAPSNELREWFSHEDKKWDEFKKRYFKELDTQKEVVKKIFDRKKSKKIIFLYAAHDEEHNNAVALKEYIESKIW